MAVFIVRHEHTPESCPAQDPYLGAGLLNHLSQPNLRRPYRIAGHTDDAVLLAERVQRLHRLFGEADDAAGREAFHVARYAELAAACHCPHYLRRHCLIYVGHP